jgi:hypothetical protein
MSTLSDAAGRDLPARLPHADDAVILDERTGNTQHRDLALIQTTETDGITINRTKTGISPFVPIVKTPTYSAHSGTLSGYSVEIEDPEQETGHRCVGNVSPNYLLLTNEQVRDLALEIAGEAGMAHQESRIFWDGARFLHVVDFVEEAVEVTDGDPVGLSLVTRSSYDKSWRFEMALMGKRFVCDNGVVSGEFFARVGFKHMERQETAWQDVVRQAMAVIQDAPGSLSRFVAGLRALRRSPMTDELLRHVWRLHPSIGDGIKGQIMSRYVEHEEPTLFGFLNAGTNVFWHREKMTAADFANNDVFSTALLDYAQVLLN